MRKEHIFVNGIELKQCGTCKEWKPLDNYHKYNQTWDKLKNSCKECRSKKGKEYREKHRDKVLQSKRKWYQDTKQRAEERTAQQLKQGEKTCTQCNEVKPITDFRERANGGFYSICRECENVNNKIYRKENPEIINAIKVHTEQRRRKRASKLPSDFTPEQWKECKDYFNHECAYCGRKLKNLTQDHFVPLSKGGGYTKDNIVPSCRSCNSKKHNKDFDTWYKEQPFYSKARENKIKKYLGIQ